MDPKWLEGLNVAQREAVEFIDGPLLVLAGPGSGKTRVVTCRIANLLSHGVAPRQIVALTFTNKAAEEMQSRLETLAPGSPVWIGTFHRFCAWILRNWIDFTGLSSNFTIYDTDAGKSLLDGLVDKSALPPGVDAARILATISWAKNALVLPEEYEGRPGDLLGQWVAKLYPEYQSALERANAVDFDDLLLRVARLLREHPEIRAALDHRFRYILVDEYQDTNLVQYAICRALSVDYPNLAVTGDPDQSIYGWRGANIKNILEFEKDFTDARVIRLEENYRSTKKILALAGALIQKNRLRTDKELYTTNPEGGFPRVVKCFNHQEEAEQIAREIAEEIGSGRRTPKDYAIFFRMNALSRNLEHALRRLGVPFQLVRGLEFFNRKEIRDLIAYLQLIHNPSDTISFLRVINLPTRGIGKVTLHRLRNFAESHGLSLMEAARRVGRISVTPRTTKAIIGFVEMIDRLAVLAANADLEVLLAMLLRETRYAADLEASSNEEDKQRLANVQELLSEVREFDRQYNEERAHEKIEPMRILETSTSEPGRLERFLEQAALVSDTDALADSNRVSLMTLHAAKGLEFPVVYLIALEDGILPHERSMADPAQLEEERRLLFVGITRAREELRMSRTEFREYRGTYCSAMLSRFLFEFPKEQVEFLDARSLLSDGSDAGSPKGGTNDSPSPGELYLSDYLGQTPESSGGISFEEDFPRLKKSRARREKKSDTPPLDASPLDNGETLRLETDEYCEPAETFEDELVFDTDGEIVPATAPKKSLVERAGEKTAPRFRTFSPRVQTASELSIPVSEMLNRSDMLDMSGDTVSNIENSEAARNQLPPIKPGNFVRHKDYGIGVVKHIDGPMLDAVATIEFLSGMGRIEVALSDPLLSPMARK